RWHGSSLRRTGSGPVRSGLLAKCAGSKTASTRSFKRARLVLPERSAELQRTGLQNSLQQAGSARGFLDTFIVFWACLDETRGSLKIEDLLVLRILRVEFEESSLDFLSQGRVEVAAYGPVVVVVGRRGGNDLHLVG